MALYYVFFFINALLLGTTNMTYANFNGSSISVKQFLGFVSGFGFLVMIGILIGNFFIMPWWVALLLIAASLTLIPALSTFLSRIPYVGIVTSFLAIPMTILLIATMVYVANN